MKAITFNIRHINRINMAYRLTCIGLSILFFLYSIILLFPQNRSQKRLQ